MKTHIIRLENHDDVISIRDKMAWSRAPRILLAFPRRRPPKLGKLDLVLIKRAGRRFGGQLGLVTMDREVSDYAKDLRIPVFPSIPAAQRLSWRTSSRHGKAIKRFARRSLEQIISLRTEVPRQVQSMGSPVSRLMSLFIGVTAFIALGIFFVPSANIELTPQREVQNLVVPVWASPEIPGVLPSGGLPAEEIVVVVDSQLSMPASERITFPDQSATGTVLLTNLTEQTQIIPVGTVFRAIGEAGQQIESVDAAEIPAGVGQQVEVGVQARIPGIQGNIPSGGIQAIEGLIGLSVMVTNPEPLHGGSERYGRAGSEKDYTVLYEQLLAIMKNQALEELELLAGSDSFLIRDSLSVREVVREERSPAVGIATDLVTMELRVAFSVFTVEWANLKTVGLTALDTNLMEGWVAEPDSYTLEIATEPVIEPGNPVYLEVTASRTIKSRVETGLVTGMVKGLERNQAQQKLQEDLELAAAPRIAISPAWWGRLPFIPFRIAVIEK